MIALDEIYISQSHVRVHVEVGKRKNSAINVVGVKAFSFAYIN